VCSLRQWLRRKHFSQYKQEHRPASLASFTVERVNRQMAAEISAQAQNIMNPVICVVTEQSSVVHQRFAGTYRFHNHVIRISRARNHQEVGLFLNHPDIGDMFLRNVGGLTPNYTVLQPQIQHNSNGFSLLYVAGIVSRLQAVQPTNLGSTPARNKRFFSSALTPLNCIMKSFITCTLLQV
jgi:hypothetical protein